MAMFDLRGQHVTHQYNAEHITTIQGVSEEQYQRLAEELGVTRSALRSFFKILEQQQVPSEDLDHTLRQIATSYKDLHARLQRFTSDDPAVLALKEQARDAVEAGEFAQAEALLNAASEKDLEAAQHLQEVATTRLLSAAASRAANGDLKRTQLAYTEAAAYYQQAVDLLESVPTARRELAQYLNAWGLASYEAGEYPAAEPLFQRALALTEQGLGSDHPDTATSLNNLAGLYWAQGCYGEAEPLLQRALALHERTLGADHPATATSLNNLAGLYDAQERYAEAEPLYQRALALHERTLGPEHPDVATTLNSLALLYDNQGRLAEAEPLYQAKGRLAEAELLYQRALALYERALGANHPHTAASLHNLAALYQAQGRLADAEPLYQQALTIREQALRPDHPDVAATLNHLATLYHAQERYAEAEPLVQRALTIREQRLGLNHPDVVVTLKNYLDLLKAMHREADAAQIEQRLLAMQTESPTGSPSMP